MAKKNWIAGAVKNKGGLHRSLGIPEGKKIPDGSLVLGSPGKVVRQLTEDEIREIHANSADYAAKAKAYAAELKPDLS